MRDSETRMEGSGQVGDRDHWAQEGPGRRCGCGGLELSWQDDLRRESTVAGETCELDADAGTHRWLGSQSHRD